MGKTVFRGGLAVFLFKELGKILYVKDAAMKGNGLNLQTGASQKIGGIFHPSLAHISRKRFARFLAKDGGKIAVGNFKSLSQSAKGKVCRQIRVNKKNDPFHHGRKSAERMFSHKAAIGTEHFEHKSLNCI